MFIVGSFIQLETLFLRRINWVKSFKSYKLNSFIKMSVDIIAINPPIKPEKKWVKKFKQIWEIKLPKREQGKAIRKYFKISVKNLNLNEGKALLIFNKFNMEIVDIEMKKDAITEFMPISGVSEIKQTNKTTEPII